MRIHLYSYIFVFGIFCAHFLARWIVERDGRDPNLVNKGTLFAVVGGLIGGRLVHTLFYNPQFYLHDPIRILKVWEGGMASHGDAIGIAVGLLLFVKRTPSVSLIYAFDVAAAVTGLPVAFGRIANFFNHEMLGKASLLPWAVIIGGHGLIPRHPAALYEALVYFTLFIFQFCLYLKGALKKPGLLLGSFLVLIPVARLCLEFFKVPQTQTDADFWSSTGLNLGQILTLPFIAIGVLVFFRALKNRPLA